MEGSGSGELKWAGTRVSLYWAGDVGKRLCLWGLIEALDSVLTLAGSY